MLKSSFFQILPFLLFSIFLRAQMNYDDFLIWPGCEDSNDKKDCFFNKLDAFISDEMDLPIELMDSLEDGEIKIKVWYNASGKRDSLSVINSTNSDVEREVLRLLEKFPEFLPAKKGKKATAISFIIPVHFKKGDDKILFFAKLERRAVFKGCEVYSNEEQRNNCFNQSIIKHIAENFKFPEEAKKDEAGGKIIVSFIIEKDGSIEHIEIRRSVHPALDAEAIRVVSLLPPFEPATQRGEPVRMSFNLPINAKIPNTGEKKGKLPRKSKKK
ncbi:MAG: TonB family protein [Cryomorphaceae bacterium]|nr:TonB family protein [Cryomorphaceae bacterium]